MPRYYDNDDYRDDSYEDKLDIPVYLRFDSEDEDPEQYSLLELDKMVRSKFFEDDEAFEVYSMEGDILVAYKDKGSKYLEYDWDGINSYWEDESSNYRNYEFY